MSDFRFSDGRMLDAPISAVVREAVVLFKNAWGQADKPFLNRFGNDRTSTVYHVDVPIADHSATLDTLSLTLKPHMENLASLVPHGVAFMPIEIPGGCGEVSRQMFSDISMFGITGTTEGGLTLRLSVAVEKGTSA